MGTIVDHTITVTITGTDTAGSAQSAGPINGTIRRCHVAYANIAAATCDVVISTLKAPIQTILTLTDNVTNGWYAPRFPTHDPAGAALTYDTTNTEPVSEPFVVSDYITVSVAQADAGTVTVTILVEK